MVVDVELAELPAVVVDVEPVELLAKVVVVAKDGTVVPMPAGEVVVVVLLTAELISATSDAGFWTLVPLGKTETMISSSLANLCAVGFEISTGVFESRVGQLYTA